MHKPNKLKSTKLKICHIDIAYFKTNRSYTCSEIFNPVHYLFQAFNSLMRSFTGSSSLYFQVPTASSLSMMLTFSERTWNWSIRSKVTWAKSINAGSLRQTHLPKSTHNSEKSSYFQCVLKEDFCELFPLATTHAKAATSGKVVIARSRIHHVFQKITTLPLLEN